MRLFLVDISAFVFRAYYAIRPLATSKGLPSHAIYGVVQMMLRLIRTFKPEYLAVVFDSPVPSFRKTIYDQYKANRPPPPEDLIVQFDAIKDFIRTYPLPVLQKDTFEADDLIATLVRRFEKDMECVIVSADKDLMQLIGGNVSMYDSMRERWIREEQVIEKFGVGPNQVLDILSLCGDSSDNIPGVSGVGGKTATKLVTEWGSVEGIYEHLSEIAGKLREKLEKDRDMAFLSKKLATLESNLPLDIKLEDLKLPEMDVPKLQEFYQLWEFKNKMTDAKMDPAIKSQDDGQTNVQDDRPKNSNYELITTTEQLLKWRDLLKNSKGFAFDTETDGLNPRQCRLVGMSFSVAPKSGAYIPLTHGYLGCPAQLAVEEVFEALRPLFEDPALPKYAQNAKFDMAVLQNAGMKVFGLTHDTLIAAYLLDPDASNSLDTLAEKYFDHATIKFSDVVPKNGTFDQVEIDRACQYAAEDADIALRLVDPLAQELEKTGLKKCYEEIEIPLIPVLLAMETEGVLVDSVFLGQLSKEFFGRLKELEKQIYADAGTEFNIGSPKQVGDVLFTKLGLPVQRKTKTGYSTDVDVLTTLAAMHLMPKKLLEHRMLSKLVSTYVDQLPKLIHPRTGRIHTHFNQTIAATGRLTSTEPNLQNIPIRTSEGARIREAFRAPEGSVLISADYSQIELRLLAAFSKDPGLVAAFSSNSDIHALTASRIFQGSTLPASELRARAKTVNFGVLYGQSAFGLSQLLEIPQSEAKQIIESFYAQFPHVRDYRKQVLEEAKTKGYVETWTGRKRFLPDLRSSNKLQVSNAERAAFNAIFQGSAADLIKVAMIHIHELLKNFETKMILQVHDELIFEAPESEVQKVIPLIQEKMENAIACEVPLKVEVGTGKNWGEAH